MTGGQPDGLAVDVNGGVWVASAGGSRVDRYLPTGRVERSLAVPARIVTSVCFAGVDRGVLGRVIRLTRQIVGGLSPCLCSGPAARRLPLSVAERARELLLVRALRFVRPARRSLPFFFFNDPATTEIYTLSLHDALPI